MSEDTPESPSTSAPAASPTDGQAAGQPPTQRPPTGQAPAGQPPAAQDPSPQSPPSPQQIVAQRRQAASERFAEGAKKHKANDIPGALDAYAEALRLAPDAAMVYNNIGAALNKVGRPEAAIPYYKRATRVYPKSGPTLGNLARALRKVGRLDEAEEVIRQAITIDDQDYSAHYTLGLILRDRGEIEEARAAYLKCQEINPKHPDSAFEAAYTTLIRGDLSNGFKEYEARWQMAKARNLGEMSGERWEGQDIAGKRLLIRGEQGFGDNIQFARYARMCKERGATVFMEISKPLFRLFGSLEGVDRLVPYGEPMPEHDYWIPTLSLPTLFETELNSVPSDVPYLHPPARDARPAPVGPLRIGIAWQGSPTHLNDYRRSCGIEPFQRLFEIPSCVFISLQKGRGSDAVSKNHLDGLVLGNPNNLRDFADTAQLIARLDLIITVDTSLCHLAGAMGRPVWVLIPDPPDWRWLLKREDTPWYPTMRLFRQDPDWKWEPVFDRIHAALTTLANERMEANRRRREQAAPPA